MDYFSKSISRCMQLINNLSLTKTKRYTFILAIIGLMAISLIVYFVITTLLKSRKTQEHLQYNPTIPQYEVKKLEQPVGFDEELAKIADSLPHKGQNYIIEYLQANVILVKVSADTQESYFKAKQDAEEFFRSKGVKDLCILKISWLVQSDTLRKSLTPEEKFTTNCTR